MKRGAIAAGAFAAAVALIVGIAQAIPGSGEVIYGCYSQGSGHLRVVDSGAGCRPGEVSLNWNQEGPQGEQGPSGFLGIRTVQEQRVIPPQNFGAFWATCNENEIAVGGGYANIAFAQVSANAPLSGVAPELGHGWLIAWANRTDESDANAIAYAVCLQVAP